MFHHGIRFLVTYHLISHFLIGAIDITLAGIFAKTPGFLTGLPNLGPAYELAASELQREYNFNTSFHILSGKDIVGCPDIGQRIDLLCDFYHRVWDRKSILVLLGAGCDEIIEVAKPAREWNVLVLPSTISIFEERNRTNYPTLINISPIGYDLACRILMNFFIFNSWTNVAVVYDTDARKTPAYIAYARSMRETNVRLGFPFNLNIYPITSDDASYDRIFPLIRVSTRIIVLLMLQTDVRPLMIRAAKSGMTSGEYRLCYALQQYITSVIFDYPPRFGVLQWQKNDTNDMVAKEAYGSLLQLCVSCTDVDEPLLQPTLDYIKTVGLQRYNATYAANQQPNLFAQSAYFSIKLVGQVINESLAANADPFNGIDLAHRLSNRTLSVKGREVILDNDGFAVPSPLIRRLNPATNRFESVVRIHPAASVFTEVYERVGQWSIYDIVAFRSLFPPNAPFCGYIGDKPVCQRSDGTDQIVGAGIGAIAGILVLSAVAWFIVSRVKDHRVVWLGEDDLHYFPKGKNYLGRSTHSLMYRRLSVQISQTVEAK